MSKYMQLVTSLIQRGIDEGEFLECSPKKLAVAIGAIIEGTILVKVYDPEIVNLEEDIRFGALSLIERYETKP
jgi:hypothetical protein